MKKRELELRIKAFSAEHPVERTRISKSYSGYLQVELILKPRAAVTERLMVQLEAALGYELESLTVLRLPGEKILVRFKLPPPYQSDTRKTDRIEEPRRCSWRTIAVPQKGEAPCPPVPRFVLRRAVRYGHETRPYSRGTPGRRTSTMTTKASIGIGHSSVRVYSNGNEAGMKKKSSANHPG
jgi:hypothetical protein